ncbi:phosphoglycolate phosphatase [Alkalicoccus urumqiensis]|uniref:Phosphoglycolate phosphatase n=2 Tax=Alkalicoccus urumqiensis TaxID=1548213 RepID=A0A2P6ML22_ALKUR|nr:phosphoglycolate phosphatase [Alkalicoccus urumqiensis]
MDGTLLRNDHTISEQNKHALVQAKEKGIHIVIATGRSLMAVESYVEELGLDGHLITGNGSEIWKLDGRPELVERTPLESRIVDTLWNIRRRHNTRHWAATTTKVWKQEMPDDIIGETWLKFGYDTGNPDVRDAILEELKDVEHLIEITNSHPLNLEINAKGVHKADAVQRVLSWYNLSFENVIACGDSLNDKTMIEAAGLGVAMHNAQEDIKHSADFVTKSNDDHGVAEAFRHFGLI